MIDPIEQFDIARHLGEEALLRLRAEGLLEYADNGEIPLTTAEREELERIASAAKQEDRAFLNGFDHYLEAMDNKD